MSFRVKDLRDMKFSEATPEQFKTFWEGEGWTIREGVTMLFAVKNFTGTDISRKEFKFGSDGTLTLFPIMLETFTTFGEALDAANELANTKVFGGWA